MFSYLRYFYAFSLVLVIGGSIMVGNMLHSMSADNMASLVREHDKVLADRYINNVWYRFYPSASDSQDSAHYYEKLGLFRSESETFTEKLPKLRFTVSAPNGQLIYRSNDASLLNDAGEDINRYRFREKMEDQPVSQILGGITMQAQQVSQPRTVIQSLIPIVNPRYNPALAQCAATGSPAAALAEACVPIFGVIEIVSDVSGQWNDLTQMQWITIASIVGIFVVLISVLFITTQRAEAIIAKQHEANAELVSAAAAAEAENQNKSQFLANISHELRTPLNAIIGFSEIIKNEALPNLNTTHQEYINDIHHSGKHLLSLINDILDYSKAEAGKLEVALQELDLTKLLVNSMRLVIPRAEEAQVTLAEDLPKEHIICVTDGKKLKQVLLNLLSNAVKFTPPGGEVRVHAFQKVIDGTIIIKVSDSGIGIAAKDIAKVMSPFGQVDSKLSRKYDGTGLGLPLSKKLIESLGGRFEIESVENVGTSVIITLPMPKQAPLGA